MVHLDIQIWSENRALARKCALSFKESLSWIKKEDLVQFRSYSILIRKDASNDPSKKLKGKYKRREIVSLVFIDQQLPNFEVELKFTSNKNRIFYLLIDESQNSSELFKKTGIDDFLVLPFRKADFLAKIRSAEQIINWRKLVELNQSFSELMENFEADLQKARAIHQNSFPNYKLNVPGMVGASRYLAGSASGGDYFEVIDLKEAQQTVFVLSRVNNYGLMNKIMGAIQNILARYLKLKPNTPDELRTFVSSVRALLTESLTPKDQLSFFFGILDHRTKQFVFVNFGNHLLLFADPGQEFNFSTPQSGVIQKSSASGSVEPAETVFSPRMRMVLLSEGLVKLVGGRRKAIQHVNHLRSDDPYRTVHELIYLVKSKQSKEELPDFDCTIAVAESIL